MLFQYAFDWPEYYLTVVVTVTVSVVLHELAHAFAAHYEGDDTPAKLGYFTLNPLKHMGPYSLLALALIGIAWGACPVNPSKFRHRYGDAIVAAAGPAMNLVLMGVSALVFLAAGGMDQPPGVRTLMWIPIYLNAALFLLNMVPLPPLDGHSVVASFFPSTKPWFDQVGANGVIIFFVLLMLPLTQLGLPFDFGDLFWGAAAEIARSAIYLWAVFF